MEDYMDISDDQIRVIGEDGGNKRGGKRGKWLAIALVAVLLLMGLILLLTLRDSGKTDAEPGLFDPEPTNLAEITPAKPVRLGRAVDSLASGFTEVRDTVINDIPIMIYIPHNAEMSLHVGRMDKTDTTVVFTAQAADVRADNGGIVGAFVLAGKPLSWGLSKKGYCASIDGVVTVGVADNSPLFEEATDKGGYFFRQYPLVSDGQLIENEQKGKAIRRGICDRQGEIFMTETLEPESFHDFSQALIDLGVDQAVYLVGSTAYGWAVDENGDRHEFGDENYYNGRRRMPKNTSYMVWRKK